jgi:hypothetical protein
LSVNTPTSSTAMVSSSAISTARTDQDLPGLGFVA